MLAQGATYRLSAAAGNWGGPPDAPDIARAVLNISLVVQARWQPTEGGAISQIGVACSACRRRDEAETLICIDAPEGRN